MGEKINVMFTLKKEQFLKTDIKSSWDFFSNPANLSKITPPWLNFKIISALPEKMYQGMVVEYRVHPFLNIPIKWITEITHADEPCFFVDEQRFGPYKFWHHKHFFKETDGGVSMTDEVHYILPIGFLGVILNSVIVKNKLEEIFGYRFKTLEKIFNEVAQC